MPSEKESKKTDHEVKEVKVTKIQGDDISTAGFVVALVSIFTNLFMGGLPAVAGLVLSIMGRIQSSRAGHPNKFALAGIIISSVVMVLTFIAFILLVLLLIFSDASQGSNAANDQCSDMPLNVQQICRSQQSNIPSYQYRHM